jgi:hypothetical protein
MSEEQCHLIARQSGKWVLGFPASHISARGVWIFLVPDHDRRRGKNWAELPDGEHVQGQVAHKPSLWKDLGGTACGFQGAGFGF